MLSSMLRYGVVMVAMCFQFTMAVRGPPRVMGDLHQREQSVQIGDSLRMLCPVEADPPAMVQWKKDGESIHFGWERYTTKNKDHILQVRDIEKSDSGVYQCDAVNGFGSVEVAFTVIVFSPADVNGSQVVHPDGDRTPMSAPYFSASRFKQMQSQQFQTLSVGSSVRLRCRAEGRPKPLVYWYKDGQLVSQQTNAYHVYQGGSSEDEDSGVQFRLTSVSADQSGRYTCRAVNNIGTVNFTYTISVIEQPSELPEFIPPYVANTTVHYHGTAVLYCYVHSMHEPIIQWLKKVDSQQANGTIWFDNEHYMVLSGRQNGVVIPHKDDTYLSRLTLANVTEHQAGLYICSATNTRGYSYRGAYLTISRQPGGGRAGGSDGRADPTQVTQPSTQTSSIVVAVTVAAVFFVVFITVAVVFARRRHRQRLTTMVNKYGANGPSVQSQQRRNNNKMAPTAVALVAPSCARNEQLSAGVHQHRYQMSPSVYNGLLYPGDHALLDCHGTEAVRLQMNADCYSRNDST